MTRPPFVSGPPQRPPAPKPLFPGMAQDAHLFCKACGRPMFLRRNRQHGTWFYSCEGWPTFCRATRPAGPNGECVDALAEPSPWRKRGAQ